jgi:hypothetical protein
VPVHTRADRVTPKSGVQNAIWKMLVRVKLYDCRARTMINDVHLRARKRLLSILAKPEWQLLVAQMASFLGRGDPVFDSNFYSAAEALRGHLRGRSFLDQMKLLFDIAAKPEDRNEMAISAFYVSRIYREIRAGDPYFVIALDSEFSDFVAVNSVEYFARLLQRFETPSEDSLVLERNRERLMLGVETALNLLDRTVRALVKPIPDARVEALKRLYFTDKAYPIHCEYFAALIVRIPLCEVSRHSGRSVVAGTLKDPFGSGGEKYEFTTIGLNLGAFRRNPGPDRLTVAKVLIHELVHCAGLDEGGDTYGWEAGFFDTPTRDRRPDTWSLFCVDVVDLPGSTEVLKDSLDLANWAIRQKRLGAFATPLPGGPVAGAAAAAAAAAAGPDGR